MARINNLVKFFTWLINLVIIVIGGVGLIMSVYTIFADWGGLDTGFFLGLGITGALMAGCLLHISMLGIMSVDYQNLTYKDHTPENTKWTGKKIILIYLICVSFFFGMTCFLTMYITNESTSLESTLSSINEGTFIEYDDFEVEVSKKFNEFFFGVIATCEQLNLLWFWDFVAENCPSSIGEDNCAACTSNWMTTCTAHENSCFADYDVTAEGGGSATVPHQTCPYEICRAGIISFIIGAMDQFLIVVACMLGLFGLLSVLATMLLCYHERDSNEVYLEKAGAVARKRPGMHGGESSGSMQSSGSTKSPPKPVHKGSVKKSTGMAIDNSATKTNTTPRAAQPTKKK